jgi:hypothetical protein
VSNAPDLEALLAQAIELIEPGDAGADVCCTACLLK